VRRYDVWAGKGAQEGTCASCRAEVLVINYITTVHDTVTSAPYCFVCGCIMDGKYIAPNLLPIIFIISSLFQELRLPKKPPKPKGPKLMKRNKGAP
jgi:hypothetical protein